MKTILLTAAAAALLQLPLAAADKKPVALRFEERAAEIFKNLDKNDDGNLNYEEFAAAKVLAEKKESEIRALYREFDEKRDNKVTLDEFTKGLKDERRERAEDLLPRQWRLRR